MPNTDPTFFARHEQQNSQHDKPPTEGTEHRAACDSQTASPFGCLNNFY